jgi:hypothetical protein
MVNENKKENVVYSIPCNSDINRMVRYLIHHQEIGENYVPAYDIIVTKYINLAKLRNIKTMDARDHERYPCNENLLKDVICALDRYE